MRLLTMKGREGNKNLPYIPVQNSQHFFFLHHLNPRQGMSFINVSHPHMKGVAIIRVTDCVYKVSSL